MKAYCNDKPVYDKDKLECIELEVLKENMDKIKSNQYHTSIKDNKLILQEIEKPLTLDNLNARISNLENI